MVEAAGENHERNTVSSHLLFEKTILVTRPRRQARDMIAALTRRGARVVAAPTIRILPPRSWRELDASLRRLKTYDALIFTSANGVFRFFERADKILRRKPARPKRLYAIGPATSRALSRYGWRGVGVPEMYEGEALARHIGKGHKHLKGWNILIPRARIARDVLPRALARRGAHVDVVEAYRTRGDPSGLRMLRRAVRNGGIDFVTFTSSSTVEQFMTTVRPAQARRFFRRARAASIGPITSSTLRRHGVRRIIQARTFTTNGLVQAILRDVRHDPSPSPGALYCAKCRARGCTPFRKASSPPQGRGRSEDEP